VTKEKAIFEFCGKELTHSSILTDSIINLMIKIYLKQDSLIPN